MRIFNKFSKKPNNKEVATKLADDVLAEAAIRTHKPVGSYSSSTDIESLLTELDSSTSVQNINSMVSEEASIVKKEIDSKTFDRKFGNDFKRLQGYFYTQKLGINKRDDELNNIIAAFERRFSDLGIEFDSGFIFLPYLLEREALNIATPEERAIISKCSSRFKGNEIAYSKMLSFMMEQYNNLFGHDNAYFSNAVEYANGLCQNILEEYTAKFGKDFIISRDYLASRSKRKNSAFEFLFEVLNMNYGKIGVEFKESDILVPYYIEMEGYGVNRSDEARKSIDSIQARCGNDEEKFALILATLLSTTHMASRQTLDNCLNYISSMNPNIEEAYKTAFGRDMLNVGIDERFKGQSEEKGMHH